MDKNAFSIIAHIKSDFPTKFGIPRQSGLAKNTEATIIFTPEFRNPDALRGIEGYSHLWLIWQFSQAVRADWSPTVRPPRLGGNTRLGVFATRSPFRPNSIGLSSVKLLGVEQTKEYGTVLHIGGADLLDGTPVFDIKPYLAYTDSHPDAVGGFTDSVEDFRLQVDFPDSLLNLIPVEKRTGLLEILSYDPRPSYQQDKERIYGLDYAGFNIRFTVDDGKLTVIETKQIGDTHDH